MRFSPSTFSSVNTTAFTFSTIPICLPSTTPITGEPDFYLGIDIGVSKGTPIYSIMDGTVYLAGWNGGYGFCVIIVSHDKSTGYWYVTRYAHLSSILVSVGDTVTIGRQIALSENTGSQQELSFAL